jgi:hypothetical protein
MLKFAWHMAERAKNTKFKVLIAAINGISDSSAVHHKV